MAMALKENRPIRNIEVVAERPDGTRVPYMPYPTPLHDCEGKLIGAINMMVDLTERKQAESQQKILIDELNHRVKNTLATVQSLTRQAARHAENLEDFVRRFEARLVALARAHDLLSKLQWQYAPLGSLVPEVLGGLIDGVADRSQIEGPPIDLKPRAALSLAMALSELATNAAKYGALSTANGRLSIAWQLCREQDRTLVELHWRERDGPPVTPPSRRGFGSRLMELCIEGDLEGQLDLIFAQSGVQCCIKFPLKERTKH